MRIKAKDNQHEKGQMRKGIAVSNRSVSLAGWHWCHPHGIHHILGASLDIRGLSSGTYAYDDDLCLAEKGG